MTPALFEKFTRAKGLTPEKKLTLEECEIYIADGFKNDNPKEYPWGYWETAWATARNGMDIAQCLEFQAFHDPEYPSPEEKKRLRVNAAIREAVKWVGMNVESGRYDQ